MATSRPTCSAAAGWPSGRKKPVLSSIWKTTMRSSTIIIPAFNQAALTAQCLRALLGQGHRSIVVVDDGSKDTTAKMLAEFRGQIKVVTHTANKGFARSCNDGAALASGDYLVFLNNDTLPQTGWLESLVDYAEK